jgi:hypothetical protein
MRVKLVELVRHKMRTIFWLEIIKGRGSLEDKDVNGKITLKLSSETGRKGVKWKAASQDVIQ